MGKQSPKEEKKLTVEEQLKKEKIGNFIDKLSKISEAIDSKADEKSPEFTFNDSAEKDCTEDLQLKVYEDIDIKDVSKGSKFTIRILNRDGVYVDIDMFAYRDIVLDNEKSEEGFITSKIERIIGVNSDIDKASRAICDCLSKLCYQRDLQIKRYRELGWDFYNGVRIFKYDKIYSVSDKIYDIKGECTNEVGRYLTEKNADNSNFELWLANFSLLVNYSDMDALIMATACTGVVRQLLPYTKENNINMNIVGKRASGKSIISHFALSMFGDPMVLEGSFTDTDNAMEMIRAERPVLPYMLDERMLKVEGKADDSKRRTLLMDIFREYEGKVKERLAGQGKELSGKRTYGPIISSSVKPMLDELLKESRDLGQYRRFIELKVKKEDLFNGSEMAESAEKAAYEHYGYGVNMLVEYLIGELVKDEKFVEDTYSEIKDIISAVLHMAEKKYDLEGLLCPCTQRFALIITTLEFLLRVPEEMEAISGIWIKFERDKLGKWLDTGDLDNVRKYEEDGKGGEGFWDEKWEGTYLGRTVKSHFMTDTDPYQTSCWNVLGILLENLIKKMQRLDRDSDINIYDNIIKFIQMYNKEENEVFFTKKAKWNGKGGYIGKLVETEKQYIIQVRINKYAEWVLVYGGELTADELRDCLERLESASSEDMAKKVLQKIFGNVILKDFGKLVATKYKDRITWNKGNNSRGAGNVTLAEIVVEKDIVDSKGMKDSDKKEDKENEA